MRKILFVLNLALLMTPLSSGAGENAKPKPEESFWDKFLRITGISATPSTSKEDLRDEPGDVWIGVIGGLSRQRLTFTGDYRSPVFSADGHAIFALRGDPLKAQLVRIDPEGGDGPVTLREVPSIARLVAVDREETGSLIVLTRDNYGRFDLAHLGIGIEGVRTLRPDPPSDDYKNALALAARWDRRFAVLGSAPVEVTVQPSPPGGATSSGTDVFVSRGADGPMNASQCHGDRCSQPALSSDGRIVVFIRIESAVPH